MAGLRDDLRSLHARWLTRRRKPIEQQSFFRKLLRAVMFTPGP